jgi:oxygen-dependent protoporphyrinogen oxidase
MRAGRKAAPEADPPPSRFIGFEQGAHELIEALVEQLQATMRLNAPVEQVEKINEGSIITLAGGEQITADALILATPANVTARMLAKSAPRAASLLEQIQHNSIGTISLAYETAALKLSEPIRGLMIPRREKRAIDAVVWTSAKIPARAPEGYTLLRVFFGGGEPATATMPEEELVAVVSGELQALLGITAPVVDYRLARWVDSYPQAAVGHLDLVDKIEGALPDGIYVTGASYRGLAVPDCVKQGRDTARKVLKL